MVQGKSQTSKEIMKNINFTENLKKKNIGLGREEE